MYKAPLILEDKPDFSIQHDQLFKTLIKTFFKEFIEGFFPELYPHIDFSSVKFLEQELHLDFIKGRKKIVDLLVEIKLNYRDQLLLIHLENQATYEEDFPERMFIYFNYLYAKHRKPIQPIAIFSYNKEKEISNQFTIDTPVQNVIQFNFLQLHLIKKNWKEYIQSNNPVAAALLSKMGYDQKERIQVKLEFLRMISNMEINPAKMELLYGFFDTYLQLNEKEEKEMEVILKDVPGEDKEVILDLPNSYFEKGVRQNKKKVAQKLLAKGMTIAEIVDITELSKGEIEKLAKK